jgi:putative hemolysin
MLPRELIRSCGRTLTARVGKPIPFKRLAACANDQQLISYLRRRTEILAERPSDLGDSPGPAVVPIPSEPLVDAVPVSELEHEIESLPAGRLLVDSGEQLVFAAPAPEIPRTLHEIGRLRELTFREVGEGTGRSLDLDRFDELYDHLFIWHRELKEVVGAYRIGRSDALIAQHGIPGLYTSTLFRFAPRLFESMGPALELGRSFIRPEHQRSYAGLMLLWKGIGRYVLDHPGYWTLFGPVSISAEYASASQQLIVTFLKQNSFAHPWARWVRPRNPFRSRRHRAEHLDATCLDDLEEVSAVIAEIEADEKGVPILLRQYLKLGGRMLGFNVDPDFSNVLDVLIMVDLRRTEPRVLSRYMGREDASRFIALHREPDQAGEAETGDQGRLADRDQAS